VPWLVEDVASARRSRAYRSLVATVRDLANGLQRMGNLDAVLREVAQHPRPELREMLTPLQTALSMEEGLLDMAERSRSPFVEDVCVLLLAGRSRDPRELVNQLRDQVNSGARGGHRAARRHPRRGRGAAAQRADDRGGARRAHRRLQHRPRCCMTS